MCGMGVLGKRESPLRRERERERDWGLVYEVIVCLLLLVGVWSIVS